MPAKKTTTFTSTPKQKASIKKKEPYQLYSWYIRANIKASNTFEKTTKSRQPNNYTPIIILSR